MTNAHENLLYFHDWGEKIRSFMSVYYNSFPTRVQMKLSEIVNILDASILAGQDQLDKEILRGGASDLMSDILIAVSEGCIFLTGLVTVQAVRTSVVAGVGAMVFVRGKEPPPEVIEMARAEGVPLLSTPYSMFVSCGRLHAQGITGLDGNR